MRWLRQGWLRTGALVFLACLVAAVAVTLAGGWIDPLYAVVAGIAVAALVAGVQVAADRIDPWHWPENPAAVPRFRRVGTDDRARELQHLLTRDDPHDRATAIRPVLAATVAERLSRRRGLAPDEALDRADEWLSVPLADFLTGARTSLTLAEFDVLMKEIDAL